MSESSRALGFGEHLVRHACRYLPSEVRGERYREWTEELPHILHDPDIRFAPLAILRMLAFASDQSRGALVNRTRGALVDLRRNVAIATETAFARASVGARVAAEAALNVVLLVATVLMVTAFAAVLPGTAAVFAVSSGAPDVIVVLVALAGLAVEAVPVAFLVVSAAIHREDGRMSLRSDSPDASARIVRQLMEVSASRWG